MKLSKKQLLLTLSVTGLFSLVACQSIEQGTGQKASSTLDSKSGSQAKGEVTFVWQGHDVLINAKFSGLKPNSEQGFHVHEKGDCSAPDATSAVDPAVLREARSDAGLGAHRGPVFHRTGHRFPVDRHTDRR